MTILTNHGNIQQESGKMEKQRNIFLTKNKLKTSENLRKWRYVV